MGMLEKTEEESAIRNAPTRFICIPGKRPVKVPKITPIIKAIINSKNMAVKEKSSF